VRAVFLDSSVIIDHLWNRLTAEVVTLRDLFEKRELVIGDLVLMEVLQGVREARLLRSVEEALGEYPCFDLGGVANARNAAAFYRRLRSVGVTPRSSIDVLIATFCLDQDLELLASDRDFRLMAPHIGLALAGPTIN
jgi:predicted nucleic acid-binding protein